MEVSFTIQVRLPDVEIKSIVFDECGNADVLLSAGGVEAKCQIDAAGSDHGSVLDAVLSLAGVKIAKIDQILDKRRII
jgi:hypothetical protein